MSTAWMDADLVAVATIMDGWDDATWPLARPRRRFHEPVQDGTPVAFARWFLGYQRVSQGSFDPSQVPLREGEVEIQFWCEPASGALVSDMRAAAADLFTDADASGLVYFAPRPIMYGESVWPGPDSRAVSWWVEGLAVPFKGV